MVIFKLLYLSYMPTTLYFSYFRTNSIAMLYLVHKYKNKNSAEVDIAPAFGEIITACNVGQEINFISRLDVNFLDLTQNIDKVSGA